MMKLLQEQEDILDDKSVDTGLVCLVLVVQALGIAAEEEALRQNCRLGERLMDTNTLIQAAKCLKLKTKKLSVPTGELGNQPIPAIAIMQGDGYVVIGRCTEGRIIVFDPRTRRSQTVAVEEFVKLWSGQIITLRKPFSFKECKKRFNVGWFMPSLILFKKFFAETIVAAFFLQLFGLVTPLFTQVIIDKVLPYNGTSTLDVLAVALLASGVLQTALGILRTYVFTHTTNKVDVILGARLFRHITALPLRYFELRRVGDTLMRISALNTIREFMTGTALTALMDTFFSIVFIAVMFYYSSFLTWIALAAMPFFLFQNIFATPIYQKRLEAVWAAGAESNSFLVETVTGIHTIKSLAVEPQFNYRWEQMLSRYVKTTFDSAVVGIILGNSGSLIQRLSGFALLWFGGHMVIDGHMTIGQLIAFQMLAGQAGEPLQRLMGMWQQFQQAALSAERLGDIIATPPEMVNHSGVQGGLKPLQGSITFEQVVFRYVPDAPPVLQGIGLHIKAGMKIGIVGRSGSGKSTLTKLVQRLYLPEKGRILLDDGDVSQMDPAWLRRQIGVVLQENFLFNGSVRDNIATARPGASMEEVIRAAEIAGAHEFILELSEGYDTRVGERGMALSGGQRQRIAIARAILVNPRILIFDEATSALDYQSERIIMKNMDHITAGRTALIIAHRLSTVRRCDLIVVVDRGCIVEQGTHEELLAKKGLYYNLYMLQQEVR
ncbi:peptidase domain-containing ABC transporter [Pelosinus sp. UFO1]|uniref:peptidase domain-containing ABC transporter n=1 Tax=Pelosinus sp. UFO1 TaxID=484770 RepID=UPI0004D0CB13|nr:type I secretion system permease/ATPase [Pelosinus sp. UFO1]AIF49856.1 type I secretion system ATPase [Pelosinus sp. UFO1]